MEMKTFESYQCKRGYIQALQYYFKKNLLTYVHLHSGLVLQAITNNLF